LTNERKTSLAIEKKTTQKNKKKYFFWTK